MRGKLSYQVISTFSSPCFGVKIVYKYGDKVGNYEQSKTYSTDADKFYFFSPALQESFSNFEKHI
jgi:hypothetical protein